MSNRRPLLQFSLRALFAALLVSTVALAIVSGNIRQGERQRYIIAEVQRLGGTIFYADERVPDLAHRMLNRVGMVLWIESGRVKQSRWNAHKLSQDELFQLTREAFSPLDED